MCDYFDIVRCAVEIREYERRIIIGKRSAESPPALPVLLSTSISSLLYMKSINSARFTGQLTVKNLAVRKDIIG
jgi:hypothetical protein